MPILITGGAGYIGSHTVLSLLDRGEDVVVLDNLSTGSRALVPPAARFIEGEVGDQAQVGEVLAGHAIDAVIHFAGSTVVPESVENPLKYYRNNTACSRDLLEACAAAGVGRFIFSSTAAVYGAVDTPLVTEDAAKAPVNPYGRSKLMTEWMLADLAAASALRYTALRYFNVAGADPKGRSGQSTPGATHLIKRACQAALGRISHLGVFGDDYPTPDGTGVRDYIHVADLAEAHVLALDHLRDGGDSATFNCGYGHGFSVREVVNMVEQVSGLSVPVRQMPRRPGDPAMVVADSARIKQALGWAPKHDDLESIVRDAFRWEQSLVPAA